MAWMKVAEGAFAGLGATSGTDTDWKVELWRDAEVSSVTKLTFPHDRPLVIDWEGWKPEQAIQGSMTTLRLESMTDREFISYYSTRAGQIVLKVYRRAWEENEYELAWVGALDPEFYEEPYSTNDGYDVTMTFSDFGTLDRIPYSFPKIGQEDNPLVSILAIMAWGAEKMWHIDAETFARYPDTYANLIGSTYICGWGEKWWEGSKGSGTDGSPILQSVYTLRHLDDIMVLHTNFFDEEDEPRSMREVLEAVLLPLGFHLIQRGGKLVVYDTQGIVDKHERNLDGGQGYVIPYIHWTSTDQQLRTCETYNRVGITLSTYEVTELSPEVTPDTTQGEQTVKTYKNADTLPGCSQEAKSYLYHSFRLLKATQGSGMNYISSKLRYFQIYSLQDGQDCTGVIFHPLDPHLEFIRPAYVGGSSDFSNVPLLFCTGWSKYLSPFASRKASIENDNSTYIRLTLDMLLDVRINPFCPADPEIEGLTNLKEAYEKLKMYLGWVCVPARIVLRDYNGKITHFYSEQNSKALETHDYTPFFRGFGEWVPYKNTDVSHSVLLLQWYADKAEDVALNGWTTNRPTTGRWLGGRDIGVSLANMKDGLRLTYPQAGGFIELQVLDGLMLFSRTGVDEKLEWHFKHITENPQPEMPWYYTCAKAQEIMGNCTWRAFRNIKFEVVHETDTPETEAQDSDFLTEGLLHNEANESLDLTFECGCAPKVRPSYRAQYHVRKDGVLSSMYAISRNGRFNRPEEITLGSILSQYAVRRTALSGEATETMMEELYYCDYSSDGLFIYGGGSLDCKNGTEQITLIELRPDEYASKDIKNPYAKDDSQIDFRPYEQHDWDDTDGSWGNGQDPDDDRDWDDDIDPWDDYNDPWDNWDDPWDE